MLSFVIPGASHTDLITKKKCPSSSFPTPLNISNLIELLIPIFEAVGVGGRVGVGIDGSDVGEVGGGVDGGGIKGSTL